MKEWHAWELQKAVIPMYDTNIEGTTDINTIYSTEENMKFRKLILRMIGLAIVVSLCGCGVSQEGTEADSTPSPSPSPFPSPSPSATEPEPTQDPKTTLAYHSLEEIQARGTLFVALQSENSKMSYWVPEDIPEYADRAGQPSGYVPFLCQQLAEDLGVKLEFVLYDVAEEQLLSAEAGDVDFSANVWSITDDRLERFTMTDNILVTDIEGDEVFLLADPEQPTHPLIDSEAALSVARIAAVKGTVQVDNIHIQYPEAKVLTCADNAAVLEALLAGEADAAVFTTYDKAFADILVEAILDSRICQCEYEIVNPEIQGVGFVLMKGNTELCDYINERLAQYRSSGLLQELNDLSETEAKAMGII